MPVPQDPPEFVIRELAEKAAADNGFRLRFGAEPGGWLRFASTTARGRVWIAGASPVGPWFLSLEHPGVAAEISTLPRSTVAGPGIATFMFGTTAELHATLERVYRLGVSLPNAPLDRFRAAEKKLPSSTEIERLVVQRIGQDIFRGALIDYWNGRCAVTGLAVEPLLRASHIKPWAACETDAERLDVFNGLLLAPNLDAAFDRGFITVADDGAVTVSPMLSKHARMVLGLHDTLRVQRLTEKHRNYLHWHRERLFLGAERAARASR